MEDILIGTTDRTILIYVADPASTDGSGKTGLTHADFTVSYTRVETDNDVAVTDATGSLTTLTNLTDAHADWGLKEVSSSLAPGLYRLDVADAVFASGAWYAVVYAMITTSAASATPKAFHLIAYNALDGVRLGLTSLPNVASGSAGAIVTSGTGTAQLSVSSGLVTLAGVTHTNAVIPTVTTTTTATNVTTVNGLAANVITATSINADAITAAKIADNAIDTATFASGCTIPRVTLADTLTTYTSNTPQTGDSFARIGLAGAGLTAVGDTRIANLDAAVTTRMATYTQPTGFLAATFPSGTVANTTNITAGTITTATNLTNAPTVGDLTTAMKASVNTEVDTAITDAALATAASLATVAGYLDTEVAAILSAVDTEVAAIKVKTDLIPAAFPTNFADMAITATTGLVKLNLAQIGLTPRALDAVADAALTVGDALVAAICGAAGDESVIGTAYAVKTPVTNTVIRTFTLDDASDPTSRT